MNERRLRRAFYFGLFVGGGGIVVNFAFSAISGSPWTGQALAWLAIGIAIVSISFHSLLPSSSRRRRRRLAELAALSDDEYRRVTHTSARRLFLAALVLLAALVPVAIVAWPSAEWRGWGVAAVGTTALFVLLTGRFLFERQN